MFKNPRNETLTQFEREDRPERRENNNEDEFHHAHLLSTKMQTYLEGEEQEAMPIAYDHR